MHGDFIGARAGHEGVHPLCRGAAAAAAVEAVLAPDIQVEVVFTVGEVIEQLEAGIFGASRVS